MRTSTKTTRTLLLALLPALLLVLSACNTAAPRAPIETAAKSAGLEFEVDPRAETVTPVAPAPAATSLRAQAEGDTRRLVQGEDIRFKDFSFRFRSPNKLVVRLRVENITEDLGFAQPFSFTLSSTSRNVVKARAPLVTDEQLGGDGVLSPGETSERFRFVVTFKEDEPFAFFVDAQAKVVDVSVCTDPAAIPDSALEEAIREALGEPEGELTCEDLASLEALDTTRDANIRDLEGLQFAVNLTTLDLSQNEIGDLTPLKNLTSLTTLNLASNGLDDLTDFRPLENLSNLTTLDLAANNLTDLSGLENLSGLTFLNLSVNNLTDISALGNLTRLTTLILTGNGFRDISPLENLINLTDLDLSFNDISDIDALVSNRGLDGGDAVDLSFNPLSPEALEGIEALRGRGVGVAFGG